MSEASHRLPAQGTVEELVAATQAGGEQLPIEEVATSYAHLKSAESRLAGAVEAEGASREAYAALAAAAEHGTAATGALHRASSAITAYVADITGGGSEAAAEAAPAPWSGTRLEQGPVTPVIVERRMLGEARITAALATHSVANADVIAGAVKDCDVLVLETAGTHDSEDRWRLQQFYNQLTSSALDPAFAQEIAKHAKDTFAVSLLFHLRGTGKPVVLIDMDKDNPHYHLVQRYEDALQQLVLRATDVRPGAELREAVLSVAEAIVLSHDKRNALMKDQLAQLQPWFGRANVGLVIGSSHYEVLNDMDPVGRPSAQSLRDRVWASTETWNKAGMQLRETGTVDATLTDRVALSVLAGWHLNDRQRGENMAHQMTDEQVAMAVRQIDEIAHIDCSPEEKRTLLWLYLRNVMNIIDPKSPGYVLPIDTV